VTHEGSPQRLPLFRFQGHPNYHAYRFYLFMIYGIMTPPKKGVFMRASGIVVCVVAALLVLPGVGQSRPATAVWYFNDGPHSTWQWADSDPQLGVFWEWMSPTAIAPADTVCGAADVLQPPQEYYAAAAVQASDIYWCHFWAVIYLSNNYADHNNPVYAALGYGTPGNAASFVQVSATATVNVTNFTMGCGVPYTFDFAVPPSFTLTNQSLIIKIWTTIPPGDVHVYWDSVCCPSALYADCTVPAEGDSWGRIKHLYSE
jgi:hypothetical protein